MNMLNMSKSIEDKNGRRSRGASPSGNVSDDSMDSSDSESDGGMRVGDDFQAKIPEYNPDVKTDARAEAMLVWAPHPDLSDQKIDEYVIIAKERHGYNMEQALGMLFWHKHNVERALTDLANFTPFPDEWTVEDKVLFEQAFSFHGKSFHRIRQMLPDKSISQLVKYYYSWKKTRSRTSLMDRQARKIIAKDDSEEDSSSESEAENKDTSVKDTTSSPSSKLRPGPASKKYELHPRKNKHKKKPPRGMYLTQEDLLAFATGPAAQGDALLKQLEAELMSLKRNVQNNRQVLSGFKATAVGSVNQLRPVEATQKINARWSNDELTLAVQGIKKYGKNFRAIAEVLGNKTEAHLRSFFVNYRKRYNLDDVLASYHQQHGTSGSGDADVIDLDPDDEKMEVDESEKGDEKSNSSENGSSENKDSSSTPEVNGKTTTAANKTSRPSTPTTTKNTTPLISQVKDKSSLQSTDKVATTNGQALTSGVDK